MSSVDQKLRRLNILISIVCLVIAFFTTLSLGVLAVIGVMVGLVGILNVSDPLFSLIMFIWSSCGVLGLIGLWVRGIQLFKKKPTQKIAIYNWFILVGSISAFLFGTATLWLSYLPQSFFYQFIDVLIIFIAIISTLVVILDHQYLNKLYE